MSVFRGLLDIIYPPRCAVCGAFLIHEKSLKGNGARGFCSRCLSDFHKIRPPYCTICGKPFISENQEDHLCEDCLRKHPYYEALRAPYVYEGAMLEAIHLFKYGGKRHLSKSLGALIAQFAAEWLGADNPLLVMPVPLHPKRLRERGFNQSLLLGRDVALRLGVKLDFLSLRRVRYTQPQTTLGRKERLKNVREAFALEPLSNVKGKRILIVDDVTTTGSTLNECARILKRAAAEKVFALTLARAISH
ncbi:MAG: ComF family protein [Deltaproteobacteria bacterium]|nr:MAG: ComF family protein [Deltaproteobacteria bacterium]